MLRRESNVVRSSFKKHHSGSYEVRERMDGGSTRERRSLKYISRVMRKA